MSSTYGVVLDANVLVPRALCDTLVRAARAHLYRLHWTEQILRETERALIGDIGLTKEQAQRRILTMKDAQPYAMVEGYKSLIHAMNNQKKDRHVLAAAVKAGAQLIVTRNTKDFPPKAMRAYNIETQAPDEFLVNLYDMNPTVMHAVLNNQGAALKSRPDELSPIEYVLGSLYKCEMKAFVATVKRQLQAPHPIHAEREKVTP